MHRSCFAPTTGCQWFFSEVKLMATNPVLWLNSPKGNKMQQGLSVKFLTGKKIIKTHWFLASEKCFITLESVYIFNTGKQTGIWRKR